MPSHAVPSAKMRPSATRASYPLWATGFFLSAAFLMGGGARGDIQSLLILRPLSALAIGIALWNIAREQLVSARTPLALALLVPVIMLVQLIPLPPSIWTNLPGRELYAQAAALAEIEQPWRPISLLSYRTWNSLFAWLVPIATILLVARLHREQRFTLLPVLIGIGFISGVLGLAQAVGPSDSPFYLYEITNDESAVGLLANRNHQAAMLACLFPMLAVYASIDHPAKYAQLKPILCASAALFILPLLLVTGSRAGLALGLIGLLAGALLYRRPQHHGQKSVGRRFGFRYLIGGLFVLILGSATVVLSRAKAIERLLMHDETEDLRIQLLEPIWHMIETYFPFGIGFGAFPDVYKVHEPFELLSAPYVNHAHNDLLEFVLEGGLFAVLALLAGLAIWMVGVARLRAYDRESGRTILFGRLGATIIFIMGIASVVDYPLRVPSMSALFAVAVMWMVFSTKSHINPQIRAAGAAED